jgi:hypothetical protein
MAGQEDYICDSNTGEAVLESKIVIAFHIFCLAITYSLVVLATNGIATIM